MYTNFTFCVSFLGRHVRMKIFIHHKVAKYKNNVNGTVNKQNTMTVQCQFQCNNGILQNSQTAWLGLFQKIPIHPCVLPPLQNLGYAYACYRNSANEDFRASTIAMPAE